MQPHSVMQNFILSASITSLQGIYDVTTLQVHIMCQHTQVPHLKCFLCQTNKLLCCHFKPNPVPATNNITHADITLLSHLHLLSVYYQNLNRDNRYLSHALSTLICPQCSFVVYIYIYTFAHHLHHIGADSSIDPLLHVVLTVSLAYLCAPSLLQCIATHACHLNYTCCQM